MSVQRFTSNWRIFRTSAFSARHKNERCSGWHENEKIRSRAFELSESGEEKNKTHRAATTKTNKLPVVFRYVAPFTWHVHSLSFARCCQLKPTRKYLSWNSCLFWNIQTVFHRHSFSDTFWVFRRINCRLIFAFPTLTPLTNDDGHKWTSTGARSGPRCGRRKRPLAIYLCVREPICIAVANNKLNENFSRVFLLKNMKFTSPQVSFHLPSAMSQHNL